MTNHFFSVFQDERFMDLTIYQYGYEQCEPLKSFGPYVRNNFLFHYVISGKGVLYANDEKDNVSYHHIDAGNGFLIEPGLVNTYSADAKEPWEYIWVEFGGLRAKESMELAGLSHKSPVFHPIQPEYGIKVLEQMRAMLDSPNDASLELIGHLYLFISKLINYSSSRKKSQGGNLSEFYVREAVAYIEHNYANSITIEELAGKCRLDRSYFGKIFKNAVGRTPQDFLLNYRMTKAAELLKLTHLSIGDISKAVGYDNQLHFSRAFKNIYNLSPRTWRNQNQMTP